MITDVLTKQKSYLEYNSCFDNVHIGLTKQMTNTKQQKFSIICSRHIMYGKLGPCHNGNINITESENAWFGTRSLDGKHQQQRLSCESHDCFCSCFAADDCYSQLLCQACAQTIVHSRMNLLQMQACQDSPERFTSRLSVSNDHSRTSPIN